MPSHRQIAHRRNVVKALIMRAAARGQAHLPNRTRRPASQAAAAMSPAAEALAARVIARQVEPSADSSRLQQQPRVEASTVIRAAVTPRPIKG